MNRLRIYLAGSISRRQEIRELANQLRGEGFDITSRWLTETGPNLAYTEYPRERLQEHAIRDLLDIQKASVLVYVANSPGAPSKGGGRHFETGFAYANEKFIVVLGRNEHVFHALPGTRLVLDYPELLDALAEIEKTVRASLTEWSEENVERVYDTKAGLADDRGHQRDDGRNRMGNEYEEKLREWAGADLTERAGAIPESAEGDGEDNGGGYGEGDAGRVEVDIPGLKKVFDRFNHGDGDIIIDGRHNPTVERRGGRWFIRERK